MKNMHVKPRTMVLNPLKASDILPYTGQPPMMSDNPAQTVHSTEAEKPALESGVVQRELLILGEAPQLGEGQDTVPYAPFLCFLCGKSPRDVTGGTVHRLSVNAFLPFLSGQLLVVEFV